jgi:O-antigen/teichoic acid export membrane protein
MLIEPIASGIDSKLSERTIHAAKWRSASLLLQGLLQFGFGILLARLLSPTDFGIAAMAMIVVGLAATFAEVGLNSAVVYLRPLTERHIRTSFTFSIVVALFLTLALYVVAPLAARPFRSDSLIPILRAEALLFVLTAPGITALALLRRNLEFRRLFLVEVGSYMVGYGAVAMSLALLGFGVWSLVIGVLAQAALGSIFALASCRHATRPLLAFPESRQLFGYGAAATLNSLVSYAARNADSFIIARWLGAFPLGLYTRAFNLITVPLYYLGTATTGVLFPAMSEIRSDVRRFRTAYLLGVQITVLIAAPLSAGVAVAAPHLIAGLYGEGWSGATPALQILAAAGVFRAVYRLAGSVTYASGNVMAEVRRQAAFTLIILAGGVFAARWGIAGVAVALAVGIVFMYLAMNQLSLNIVEGRWRDFFIAHLPGLALGLYVGVVALLIRWVLERLGLGSFWIMVAILLGCAASLPLAVFLLPRTLRPVALFSRFSTPISRLPRPVRLPLVWMLRLEA